MYLYIYIIWKRVACIFEYVLFIWIFFYLSDIISALASVFGLYLLSGCAEQDCMHSSLGMGDLIAFGGTLLWSTSIIIGDSANKVVIIVYNFIIQNIYNNSIDDYAYACTYTHKGCILYSFIIRRILFHFVLLYESYSLCMFYHFLLLFSFSI